MRKFDLDAAKRGEPIMCRDGTPARFIAHVPDAREGNRVIALIGDMIITAYEDGSRHQRDMETFFDLFMAPKKRTVWVNLYPNENRLCYYYDTEEEAEEASAHKRIGNRAWRLEIEE